MKNTHTQKTDHFKACVKPALRDAMASLAELIQADFIDSPLRLKIKGRGLAYGYHETLGIESRLEPISGVAYDGFIPFQAGGFEVTQFFRMDQDSSFHFTASQTDFMDSLARDCEKDFLTDTKRESFEYSEATEKEQREYEDYERAYFENVDSALLRVELWREKPESEYLPSQGFVMLDYGRVFLRVSLGYRDSPYFRAKHDETIFELNMKERDFMRAGKKRILSIMFRKMRAAIARDLRAQRKEQQAKRKAA